MFTPVVLQQFLQLATLKHETLSQNIANVNTPGYKTKTVEIPQTFNELVKLNSNSFKQISLTVTSKTHIKGRMYLKDEYPVVKDIVNVELKPNQNNVSLQQQALEVSNNQLLYNKLVDTYKKTYDLLNAAVGNDSKG